MRKELQKSYNNRAGGNNGCPNHQKELVFIFFQFSSDSFDVNLISFVTNFTSKPFEIICKFYKFFLHFQKLLFSSQLAKVSISSFNDSMDDFFGLRFFNSFGYQPFDYLIGIEGSGVFSISSHSCIGEDFISNNIIQSFRKVKELRQYLQHRVAKSWSKNLSWEQLVC